ncbi:MAG: adenosylmethionine decarboxylase [Thermovirgaceae bacterium]
MENAKSLGRHILVEAWGCQSEALNDIAGIRSAMVDAAEAAGATVLDVSFRRFAPQGVSGVVIISESHLTIHTWPEHGYAAIDLFTCGDRAEPWKAFEVLAGFLEAGHVSTMELRRGEVNNFKNSASPEKEGVFSNVCAAGSGSGV